MMDHLCVLILLCISSVCVWSQSPVFLVDPESISAIEGTTVEFTCTADNTDDVGYRVNDTSATQGSVTSKGFNQLDADDLGNMVTRRNLSVAVSSLYNNTEILCRAIGTDNIISSNTAILTVQGPLSSVVGLSYSFINSSTVNITWSPPFTLPGTNIIGYNISNNLNSVQIFTMETYHVLLLTDITNSSSEQISITVVGYNGLDGDIDGTLEIYLPAVPPAGTIILDTVSISVSLSLSITLDVSGLSIGQRPTTISVFLFILTSGTLLDTADDIMLPQNNELNSITLNDVITVLEDIEYIIIISYSNIAGDFNHNGSVNLDTFGVQSVSITDSSNGRVCIECVFSLYSTDTGCTVELISSSIIQYTDTFTRPLSDNTATGCITNITTGLYTIRLYDQNSTIVAVETTGVNVTEQVIPSVSTSTTSASMTNGSTATETTTATPTPTNAPTSSLVIVYAGSGAGVGILIIALIIIAISLIGCIIAKKSHQNKHNINGRDSLADDILPRSSSPPQEHAYSIPNKVESGVVYAELSVMQQQSSGKPSPKAKPVTKDSTVVIYSGIVHEPPPPPPNQLMEMQSSITVIPPGGATPEETSFKGQTDGYNSYQPHINSATGEEKVIPLPPRSNTNNSRYPPAPTERAPSPPTGDSGLPPPIPARMRVNPPPPPPLDDSYYNRRLSDEEYTDESLHPELAEIRNQSDFMNTPTATYL